MHGTELLQMSCSTKQDKLVMQILQPIVFSWRQNRQSTKMYVVHHDILWDSFRMRIVWFQPKQDSDRIRISFFKNRIGSDSKKTLSDHLWQVHLRNFSCMVITSCMSVAVSSFGAEWFLGGNVLCNILMACYRYFCRIVHGTYLSVPQRWGDCENFQSESSPDPIKLNLIQCWSANFWKSSVRSSPDLPMKNHVF